MEFEKYSGLGNDFIITKEELSIEEVVKYCERRKSIGADGIIILKKKEENYYMHFYNADGSLASMCGNGIRCYVHYLYNHNLVSKDDEILIDTLSGIKKIRIINDDKNDFWVSVDMNKAINTTEIKEIKALDRKFEYIYTFTGTDHVVIYIDKEDLNEEFVIKYGKNIEQNKEVFPKGTNVNFVYVKNMDEVEIMTFERGAGLTLACGTGASAVGYISNKLGKTNEKIKAKLLGGNLEIELKNDTIYMNGPSELIYKGSVE
ncbi:diaminopimelate epimerase [Streptobacillus felis]|uniref:Diaminopimelate epimerase n=1 Tax=Streptobacillus felis TaxID=1384509 RepID=A0A7Z0PF01_9FUSO|nr:diaminopimelate epimerase [Streptobacillus felis]NYV27317.1 diaminopimelate epimerase [Streptobacillus felis]